MKLHSHLFLLMLISSITFSCNNHEENELAPKVLNYDQDEKSLTDAGWTKVFEEDFSSDFSKWNIWKGGAYNNEYQYYSNDPSNLNISDGILSITAKKETVTGATTNGASTNKSFDFTSARIESKTTISANSSTPIIRVSARIKLPTGYGMWPAFWSYGNNWPQNGEIDILEARGNEPTTYATNYFYGTKLNENLVSNAERKITSSTSLTEYWHVYEVIWEKEKLTFYLDGSVVDTKSSITTVSGEYIDDMFGKVQKIVLNLAVGGNYFLTPQNPNLPDPNTIQTSTMYVDWVRVFNKQ